MPRALRGAEPNSLASKAGRDPKLRKKLKDGEKKTKADSRSLEEWARHGFISIPEETLDEEGE